jgi:hypothetical protein
MRYFPKRLGALLGLVGFSGESPHPVPRWLGSDADTMQKAVLHSHYKDPGVLLNNQSTDAQAPS